MSRSGQIIGTMVLGGAITVGVIAAGPYLTLRRLNEGITKHEPLVVAECVDFEKLRASVKRQLRAKLDAMDSNPLAAMAKGVVAGASDSAVDLFVTPEGLEKVLADASFFSSLARPATGSSSPEVSKALSNAQTSFKSLSEFSAVIEPSSGIKLELVLEREWLRWRVVGVTLP
jgi:hypothetical protein